MGNPFKWRHYEAEIILVTVRWYLRYALSYRDLAEMMSERGLSRHSEGTFIKSVEFKNGIPQQGRNL